MPCRLIFFLVIAMPASAFAQSTVVLRPLLESAPGTEGAVHATARVVIPQGWEMFRPPKTRYRFVIVPKSRHDVDRPYISVVFGRLDPRGPATQEGQARANFSAGEEAGPFSRAGFIESSRYGRLTIYFFGANWLDRHFRVYTIEGRISVDAELVARDRRELERYRSAFEAVVRSVIIQNNHTKA
jgi:hypothetical protein